MSPPRQSKPRVPKPSHDRQRHSPLTDAAQPAAQQLLDEAPPADPVRSEARALLGSLLQLVARAATAPSKAGKLIAFADTLDLPPLPEQSAAAAPFGDATTNEASARSATAPAEPAPHLEALVTACCAAAGVEAGQLVDWIRSAAAASAEARTWSVLGAQLADRGPHRVRLAMHLVQHGALGSFVRLVPAEEEERLVTWFRALVEEAIALTGGTKPDRSGGDDNPAARAIWYLLSGDEHVTPDRSTRARCPAMAAVPRPGDPGFVPALIDGAAGYLRTVIASAGKEETDDLRGLVNITDDKLEPARPFAFVCERLEEAIPYATLRRPTITELCRSVELWASACQEMAAAFTIPPINRIASTVWLVHELRRRRAPEERAVAS